MWIGLKIFPLPQPWKKMQKNNKQEEAGRKYLFQWPI